MEPSNSKSKRTSIAVKDKLKIIARIENGEKQITVGQAYGLSKTTVNTIWKNRDNLKRQFQSADFSSESKRFRSSDYKDVDAALLKWFKQVRTRNVPINGPLLMAKANALAGALGYTDFKASTGFLDRWKVRHSISFKKVCGEEKDVPEESMDLWLQITLPDLLQQFSPENIYNLDETGLFFKMKPDRTLDFKGQRCSGGKQSKERLTVLVGCSMTGEKLPLLVIGKAKSPRCFKGVQHIPLDYTANKRAWMTGEIFTDFMKKWNAKLARERRHVLALIDNCPAHPVDLSLSNITVKFLPPNTTAKLQPCDQGIIQSLKVHYRYKLVQKMLAALDGGDFKITVLDAMLWLKYAWNNVTETTICNCFRHVGFITDSSNETVDNPDDNPDISSVLDTLRDNGVNIDCQNEEYATADEDLEVAGMLTDEDIVSSINEESSKEDGTEEDADQDDEPVTIPSYSDFYSAVDVVRRFVLCKSSTPNDLVAVQTLEKLLFSTKHDAVQTTIEDYFTVKSA